jgi:hypothetical protein
MTGPPTRRGRPADHEPALPRQQQPGPARDVSDDAHPHQRSHENCTTCAVIVMRERARARAEIAGLRAGNRIVDLTEGRA